MGPSTLRAGKRVQEGQGSGRIADIDVPVDVLEKSAVFNLLKEVIGFILYIHHQIPSILQHMEVEFDKLRTECKILDDSVPEKRETGVSSSRKYRGKIRGLKQEIKKTEKLVNTVKSLLSSLQLLLDEIPEIHEVIFVLGSTPIRPLHVYQMSFSHARLASGNTDCAGVAKDRIAEILSKRTIRALVTIGAGGGVTYSDPTKLFVLVKAPNSTNMPLHFLPRRDFRYNKKIIPFRLNINLQPPCNFMDTSQDLSGIDSTTDTLNNQSSMMWFQCRHSVKGMICEAADA